MESPSITATINHLLTEQSSRMSNTDAACLRIVHRSFDCLLVFINLEFVKIWLNRAWRTAHNDRICVTSENVAQILGDNISCLFFKNVYFWTKSSEANSSTEKNVRRQTKAKFCCYRPQNSDWNENLSGLILSAVYFTCDFIHQRIARNGMQFNLTLDRTRRSVRTFT